MTGLRGGHGDAVHDPIHDPHHPDLLWAKSQQLPEEVFRHLQTIYGDHFPIEARHHLAGKKLGRFDNKNNIFIFTKRFIVLVHFP